MVLRGSLASTAVVRRLVDGWGVAAWLLGAGLWLSLPQARAQGPTDAAVRGRVVLPVSRVRLAQSSPRVTVVLEPLGVGVLAEPQQVRTAPDGSFVIDRLVPGFYRLSAQSADGLAGQSMVSLEAGQTVEPELRLGSLPTLLSGAQQRQLVAAAAVEPSATEALLDGLPLSDRAFASLTQLDSEATEVNLASAAAGGDDDSDSADAQDNRGSSSSTTAMSYAGLSDTQNASELDGLSTNQSYRSGARGAAMGGPSAGASYGQGAVRSLRVLPQSFSAQYGGAAGGVVAVATRAASDRLHGTAFVLERASVLAAANPFSVVTHYHDGVVTSATAKPAGALTQLGASVGAPLAGRWVPHRLEHRVGLFGSIELQLHDDHIVSTPAVASFYTLSSEQVALLSNRGVGSAATNAALNYLDSLSGETARQAVRVQAFGRVDARLSRRDLLTLGYIGEHFNAPAGAALGQSSEAVVARGLGSLGDSHIAIDAGTARWLHRITRRWSAELRGQVAHDLEYETPHAPLAQEPAIGPGGYAPQVSIAPNGFAYGTPSSLGRVAYPDEQRVQLAANMQLLLGHHLVSFGADWSRIHDRIATITAQEGAFSYDSGITNGHDGGLVDWITDYTFNVNAYPNGGCPSIHASVHDFCFRSFTQSFGPLQTEFVEHLLAGFAEDQWQVREGLTLTVGARYDYTLLPLPQAPNYTLDAALQQLALPNGGVTETFPEDRNNIAPRVGIDWSPRGFSHRRSRRMQRAREPIFNVHLGYGWFYGRTPGATIRTALSDTAQASSTLRVRIRPTTITACPQVTAVQQGFGYPCAFLTTPPDAVAQTTSAVLFASRFRSPTVQRASLELERSVGSRVDVRASYTMALATQLPNSVDLNIAPSTGERSYVISGGDGYPGLTTGESFVVPLYTQRRLTSYGAITALESNSNATYHAATMEAHALLPGGLEVRGSFTFSRAIDYGAQGGARPSLNGQFDPFNHGYDKGLSSQQVPERFTGDLLWSPTVRGGGLWRGLASQWSLAALAIAAAGTPYSYQVYGGTYLRGGRESINGAGGATYLPTVGRNTLRLPAHGRVDLRLNRGFGWGQRWRGTAFVQVFNLLNTQTITSVQTRAFLLGTPTSAGAPTPLVFQDATAVASEGLTTTLPFGTPRSSTNGAQHERQLELGVRLRF